jgi:hypothetical protein
MPRRAKHYRPLLALILALLAAGAGPASGSRSPASLPHVGTDTNNVMTWTSYGF